MSVKVKFFDYPQQFKTYKKEYIEIIEKTFGRGAYILGGDLDDFEKNLAEYIGCKYAIGVGNCTDALLLALIAAGVGPGDEVISVSHTFVATIEVIKFVGATPVLVDMADDHNMNVDLVETAITNKTKAIMPVSLNGRICSNIDRLIKIAKKHKLIVIEDAAQALGARYKGKGAGTFGLAGCFSFYPAKLLGTFGDAGAVITNDKKLAEKVRMLRNHGKSENAEFKMWGLNCRMDNVHAAILNFKLKKLTGWIKRRREIAKKYYNGLSNIKALRLPPPPIENGDHYDVFQNYELEGEKRNELREYLMKKGIETTIQWGGKAVHQLKSLGLGSFKLPRTEEFFKKSLMLPLYPELTNAQVEYVIKAIKSFYRAG